MDYKERYEQALEKARELMNKGYDVLMPEIFPELKESEDEKIRKVLLNDFKNNCSEYYCEGVTRDMVIAWLEKQGESNSQTVLTLPKFTFNDVLALQCCMETVKKVQEDKELYEKLNDLHSKVYDSYQLEKQGEQPTDKNTDVPSKHKDLYNITVSTDSDITKHKVIIEDRWFDYPPNTNEQFDKVIRKEFGNRVVNNHRAWYMYLDAFKKAHPEVADEMIHDSLTLASTDTRERYVTINAALDWLSKQCKECCVRGFKISSMTAKDKEELTKWFRDRGYSFSDSEIANPLR